MCSNASCLNMQHAQEDDRYHMYHLAERALCILDANANTKTSLPPLSSLSVSEPLQYTTDDLDYSQFYDYSEGATDIIATDEYSEPQVNEKRKRKDNKNHVFSCDVSLSVGHFICQCVLCVVCVSVFYVYVHTRIPGTGINLLCDHIFSKSSNGKF